jgi:diguanylate cyclase (GGDEF)-like protein
MEEREKQQRILVVDDEPDNFTVVSALLANEGYELHYAPDGQEGLALAETLDPDLILMDFMMPQIDGSEACYRLKAGERTRYIPIIVVTALSNKEALALCLLSGADDFIAKPVSGLELRARIRSMLRIRDQHLENVALCQQLSTANAGLREFNEKLDRQVRERTAELQHRVLFRSLTGLPSRVLLLQHLTDALARFRTSRALPAFALIYIDCAQFNLINGTFGHEVGDALLMAIAQRLQSAVGPNDVVSHPASDEFCVLIDALDDARALPELTARFLHLFDQPFTLELMEVFVSVYAGAVVGSPSYTDAVDLMRDVDTALYKAKRRGKGCFEVFDAAMHNASVERLSLEHDLRRALQSGEFCGHYQPIMNLERGTIWGFEMLVRWQHPSRGLVLPGEFIGCAEETGLIVPLGRALLEQACRQVVTWNRQGARHVRLAVNLSARQFTQAGLLDDVDRILAETGVDPAQLEFEITETALMENPEHAVETLKQFKARRIQLSLDDFGTGYSSLGYLQRFPFDNLKIDRCFIRTLAESEQSACLVAAILSMSKALGIGVIAEGIETEAQLLKLRSLGAVLGQGYHFSRPVDVAQASALIIPRTPA